MSSQNYDQSAVQAFGQTPCQNRLIGSVAAPDSAANKVIYFVKTDGDEATYVSLQALLAANTDDLMATLDWGQSFVWNFDEYPVFDLVAHPGGTAFLPGGGVIFPVGGSGYYRQAPFAGGYNDVSFRVEIIDGLEYMVTSDAGQVFGKQVQVQWTKFKGTAQVTFLSTEITDASILTADAHTPMPPNPIVDNSVVIDNPTSPSSFTVYKMAVQPWMALYIARVNTFALIS